MLQITVQDKQVFIISLVNIHKKEKSVLASSKQDSFLGLSLFKEKVHLKTSFIY